MDGQNQQSCTAFEGYRLIATGSLRSVATKVKEVVDRGEQDPVLIFDDSTSAPIELDFRGSMQDVLQRLEPPPVITESAAEAPQMDRGRVGRPKLGVVAREVTLLPRHWDWLNSQPGGASVALRKLVDEARRSSRSEDEMRRGREVTYKFMSAIGGNLPGFEEAARALFAGNPEQFHRLTASFPVDIRDHVAELAKAAFPNAGLGL
jgi:uncharacterized protein